MFSDLEFSAVGLRIGASGLEDVLIKLLVSQKPGVPGTTAIFQEIAMPTMISRVIACFISVPGIS